MTRQDQTPSAVKGVVTNGDRQTAQANGPGPDVLIEAPPLRWGSERQADNQTAQ